MYQYCIQVANSLHIYTSDINCMAIKNFAKKRVTLTDCIIQYEMVELRNDKCKMIITFKTDLDLKVFLNEFEKTLLHQEILKEINAEIWNKQS